MADAQNKKFNFNVEKTRKIHISLTPLIDVVFILLIFFMLTSQFSEEWILPFKTPQISMLEENSSSANGRDSDLILFVHIDYVKWQGEKYNIGQAINEILKNKINKIQLMADHKINLTRFIKVIDELRHIPNLKIKMIARRKDVQKQFNVSINKIIRVVHEI